MEQNLYIQKFKNGCMWGNRMANWPEVFEYVKTLEEDEDISVKERRGIIWGEWLAGWMPRTTCKGWYISAKVEQIFKDAGIPYTLEKK